MKIRTYPGVPDATAERMVGEWLQIVRQKESGIIIFPPKGGAYRRIEQLLEWPAVRRKHLGKTYKDYLLLAQSVLPHSQSSPEEVLKLLIKLVESELQNAMPTPDDVLRTLRKELCEKCSISFFLYDTDEWFRKSRLDILTALSLIAEREPRVQFLLFCETDVTAPELLTQNLGTTTLAQNIVTHPYYSRQDMDHFIGELGKFWDIVIPSGVRDHILDKVGCHTWLIKEAVRIYLKENETPSTYVTYPGIRIRLETIWQQLTPTEQMVLLKVTARESTFTSLEQNSVEHLRRVGLLLQENTELKVVLPVFAEYLKSKQYSRTLSVTDKGSLLVAGDNVSHLFGINERKALGLLITHQGTVVERDTLAQTIWGDTKGEYSDWALDRIMSRIRAKLRKLQIDPERIKTVKKVGFVWQ